MTKKKEGKKMTVRIRRMTMMQIMDSDIKDRLERLSPCMGKVACTVKVGRNVHTVKRAVMAGKASYKVFAKALDHWEVKANPSINKKMVCEVAKPLKEIKK